MSNLTMAVYWINIHIIHNIIKMIFCSLKTVSLDNNSLKKKKKNVFNRLNEGFIKIKIKKYTCKIRKFRKN